MDVMKPPKEGEIVIPAQAVTIDPEGQVPAPKPYAGKKTAVIASDKAQSILKVILGGVVVAAAIVGVFGAFELGDGDDDVNRGNNEQEQVESPAELILPDAPDADCPFVGGDLDVRGDGSLLLRQTINELDATVTVQMEYFGEAWLGFAFSEEAVMVPNTAVIGLPDDEVVEKYSLAARSLDGVNPLDERQTLTSTSILQESGRTVLTFTKPLEEENEPSVVGGDQLFLWAIGSSNDLGVHALRGAATGVFTSCPNKVAIVAPPTPPPTSAPVPQPTRSPTSSPTLSPTNAPTSTPTWSPVQYKGGEGGTWSRKGHRRACAIDACPSDPWSRTAQLEPGCTCDGGLDSCWWDDEPTTTETYDAVELVPTQWPRTWRMQAKGMVLSLGEGGDFASGLDCFDDPLRGGFRIDLSNSGFVFAQRSKVTVEGYSAAMKL